MSLGERGGPSSETASGSAHARLIERLRSIAEQPRAGVVVFAFVGIAALALADLASDVVEGAGALHLALEATVTALALVGAALEGSLLLRSVHAARVESAALRKELDQTQRDAARWASESRALIGGLSAAIDEQLALWGLSEAEKETALLLLKGLSHREIGEVRGVGEATARQQARALYRKAGLDGRHDLAAFFLEDLLSPRQP